MSLITSFHSSVFFFFFFFTRRAAQNHNADYAVQALLQVPIRLNVQRCANSEMGHEIPEIIAGHREELISLPKE